MGALRIIVLAIALFAFRIEAQAARTVTYVYTDPQGTPLALADSSGNIIQRFDYKPYGASILPATVDGIGYTGQMVDGDSSLIYMQARYYDPATARFVNTDPMVPLGGDDRDIQSLRVRCG